MSSRSSGRVAAIRPARSRPSTRTSLGAALATTLGIMAAEQRGRGQHLDVAIFETALHASDGRLARLLGYQHNGHTTTRPTRVRGVANGTSRARMAISCSPPFLPSFPP